MNPHPVSHYEPMIAHLNGLPGIDGWFTQNYGGSPAENNATASGSLKRPWQRHNTRKLDAIRDEIAAMALTEPERAVLLASLVLALDKVDSTLGHYASYLKEWSPRSYDILNLEVPRLIPRTQDHAVHQADVFDLLDSEDSALAYFDPPYGSNNEKMPPSRIRYAAYYHIWTTICLNDRPPLFGAANRRTDTSDSASPSVFEAYRRGPTQGSRFIAVEAIERLLKASRARHIILSYSSGGRATAEELNAAISSAGNLQQALQVGHRRNVMAGMRWTYEWTREADSPNTEFLFLIEK
jgi:adenine-specific DNA-methyltransferase